jgi:hypothetical protein
MASAEDSTTAARRRTSASADAIVDQAQAAHAAVGMVGQLGVDLDRALTAIAGDADGLAAEGDVGLAPAHEVDGIARPQLRRQAVALEDGPQLLAKGPTRRPAGDALRHRIDAGHAPLGIGGNEAGVDGRQRSGQALFGLQPVILGAGAAVHFEPQGLVAGSHLVDGRQGQQGRHQPPGDDGRQHRGTGREDLAGRLHLVVGAPDRPDVQHMGHAAGEDEDGEQGREPAEVDLRALARIAGDGQRYREIGQGDGEVGTHHGPEQARRPLEAIAVGQKTRPCDDPGQLVHSALPPPTTKGLCRNIVAPPARGATSGMWLIPGGR